MTVDEALELARSYGVEVRLKATGNGLNLEVDADPPQALMNVLKRAKWDIIAALRQQETEAHAKLGLEPRLDPLERHRPSWRPWRIRARPMRPTTSGKPRCAACAPSSSPAAPTKPSVSAGRMTNYAAFPNAGAKSICVASDC